MICGLSVLICELFGMIGANNYFLARNKLAQSTAISFSLLMFV